MQLGQIVILFLLACLTVQAWFLSLPSEQCTREQSRSLLNSRNPNLTPPPARVYVGAPLEWRELAFEPYTSPTDEGYFGALVPGSFTRTNAAELALVLDHALLIFDSEGLVTERPSIGWMHSAVAWDMNGDGMDEILEGNEAYFNFPNAQLPTETVGYDANGAIVGVINGILPLHSGLPLTGDADGDGWLELLLMENRSGGSLILRSASGSEVHYPHLEGSRGFHMLAHLSGCGKAEVVQHSHTQGGFVVVAHDGSLRLLGNVASGTVHAADLTGDGASEVVLRAGIFSLTDRSLVSFDYPDGVLGDSWFLRRAVGGRILNGEPLVAITVGRREYTVTGICLFSLSGECVYYEEFGGHLLGLEMLEGTTTPYLVAHFGDRLLIYP